MEGKIWGISLSVLGIGGLIWALLYISGPKEATNLPVLLAAGVCGAVAFFTGIWLFDHKRSGQRAAAGSMVSANTAEESGTGNSAVSAGGSVRIAASSKGVTYAKVQQ